MVDKETEINQEVLQSQAFGTKLKKIYIRMAVVVNHVISLSDRIYQYLKPYQKQSKKRNRLEFHKAYTVGE